ncbi:TPA: UDP-2,4-diacetamido-2,4,6-trideoxy-beta-L-altropyranose hydrolase [Vibrio cholerae]|nr:UDP-2,4-diacetamido-2,4,6-trideoxy-beta-L-altropyranose hydrolase [Vibrio cholerae]
MKFIVRVDASRWIGSGHVMRCLVLADALKAVGHQVTFICRPQSGDLIDLIVERGHQLIILPKLINSITPTSSADYAAWLQVPWQQDAAEVLNCVIQADWLVVDHYGINSQWELQIKQALNCKLLAIDDLVRPHAAELILDQTLGRTHDEYLKVQELKNSKPVILSGSIFALLGSQFDRLRSESLRRTAPKDKVKILVTMGGIDQPNATLSVLKALVPKINAHFTVLLSKRAPHYSEVSEYCSKYTNVSHIEFTVDMATLMLNHHIGIGAPGSTSWERACLGLPSILIPLADNQIDICRNLVDFKSAVKVELADIGSSIVKQYHEILAHWDEYSSACLRVCDGQGTQRVLSEILRLSK